MYSAARRRLQAVLLAEQSLASNWSVDVLLQALPASSSDSVAGAASLNPECFQQKAGQAKAT